MGVSVTFDYATWIARYPEFTGVVDSATAQRYFDEATIYHANDGTGPVSTAAIQSSLLNMLTAHIAFLYSGTQGNAPSPLVGRISNASEGSVSVQSEIGSPGTLADWLYQSKYGLSYWQATAPYRSAIFVPGPRRYFAPWPYGR